MSARTLTEAVRTGDAAAGSVLGVRGTVIRLALPDAELGERLALGDGLLEVVGFDGVEATAQALTAGLRPRSGAPVHRLATQALVPTGPGLLGRVLDGLGRPMDGGPPITEHLQPLHQRAPDPLTRQPVNRALPLGVRAIDGLCTLGAGQRVALEAGPGAGKTTLLSRIAAHTAADVVVWALIGERGREIGALLADLPQAVRARTVIIAARADDPPLTWLRAAQLATRIAEAARDRGQDALLLVDSLTRVARAIRTVGVAAGEPTTRRGFPPSLSTLIAALLERATNGPTGTLTAVYAVLIEGDGLDDPVAEEARALLDGHLVLDAALAAAGRYPAFDPLRSLSRCMSDVASASHRANARTLRSWLDALHRHHDLIAVGAYQPGVDAVADAALEHRAALEAFLRQSGREPATLTDTCARLAALTGR
jgi:flagellum-specific ATP synthase